LPNHPPVAEPGYGVIAPVRRRRAAGVWDADSPQLARFDDADRAGMEALCAEFMRAVEAR